MKSINTSLFDFPTLRDPARGYVYVDKTAQIYDSNQFSPKNLVRVVVPVSLGNALSTRTLQGFWEATAGAFALLALIVTGSCTKK